MVRETEKVQRVVRSVATESKKTQTALDTMFARAKKGADDAARSLKLYTDAVKNLSRNSRDAGFYSMDRKVGGRLFNPFTGQPGIAPNAQPEGKVGKVMGGLERIGNAAAMLSLFDTFTNGITTTVNSLKKWDGSLSSSMGIIGNLGRNIFDLIGIATTFGTALISLTTAARIAAAAQATGGAGNLVGGAAAGAGGAAAGGGLKGLLGRLFGGGAGGAASGGVGAGAAAAGTIIGAILAAAGIAYGLNELLDAREAAEMNAASKSKDATGKGKAMSNQREAWQKAGKEMAKIAAAEAKMREREAEKAQRETEKAAKAAERAAERQRKEQEKAQKAALKAAEAAERAALAMQHALSDSERFLRALLPNTFAQPTFVDPRATAQIGFGGYLGALFGRNNIAQFNDQARGYQQHNEGEKLGEQIASGMRKKAPPRRMHDVTRMFDDALGWHH